MKVFVDSNRTITIFGKGQIIGEFNASVLNFEFPQEIASIPESELNKYLVFQKEGMKPKQIIDNQVKLSDLYTQDRILTMQIFVKKDKTLLYKSEIFELEFEDTLDFEYETSIDDLDIIDNLISQYKDLKAKYEEQIAKSQIEYDKLLENFSDLNTKVTTLEEARENAEKSRISNENIRVQNEQSRKNNETSRIEKENQRNLNEVQREETFNSKIEEVEEAINELSNYKKDLEIAIANNFETFETETNQSIMQSFEKFVNDSKAMIVDMIAKDISQISFRINENGELEVIING